MKLADLPPDVIETIKNWRVTALSGVTEPSRRQTRPSRGLSRGHRPVHGRERRESRR